MLDKKSTDTNAAQGAARAAYDAINNLRGTATNPYSYKERTGQKPASERAQDTVETIVGTTADSIADFLAGNWKMILLAAVALIILLRE